MDTGVPAREKDIFGVDQTRAHLFLNASGSHFFSASIFYLEENSSISFHRNSCVCASSSLHAPALDAHVAVTLLEALELLEQLRLFRRFGAFRANLTARLFSQLFWVPSRPVSSEWVFSREGRKGARRRGDQQPASVHPTPALSDALSAPTQTDRFPMRFLGESLVS